MPDSGSGALPHIRPVRDEDVESLVRLTLAAFVPVFRSFERLLGPAVYGMIWPDWRASQQKAVEEFCREPDQYSVWVAELGGAPAGYMRFSQQETKRTLSLLPPAR